MLPRLYRGRSRTFFLYGYEGIHETRPRGTTLTVPTPAERWFNLDAGFERDTKKQLQYNYRTLPFRFSGIRGNGTDNWDFSVLKNTTAREGMRLQFRAEMLNVWNHPAFSNPSTDPYSTAFGVLTSQRGYARRVQLGFKLLY